MALANVATPYDVLTDANGRIISSGQVYIGVEGEDPETNPVPIYWDAAGTVPAFQPLSVVNGYIVNTGTPAQVFVNSDYSIRLYSQSSVVYYFASILAKSISGTAGGDLTGTYPNPSIAAVAVTTSKLADKAVTNAKLAAGGDNTFKTSFAGNVQDTNGTVATALLDTFTTSTGIANGVKGLVPAPVINDQLHKFLKASGLFSLVDLEFQSLTTHSDANGSYIVLGNTMITWGYTNAIVADATDVKTFSNGGFSAVPAIWLLPIYTFGAASIGTGQLDSAGAITTTQVTVRNKNIQNNPSITFLVVALGPK